VVLRKEVETVMLVVGCWGGKKSREEKRAKPNFRKEEN
jgi:hypothetical protein